jgi:hypothetical protein
MKFRTILRARRKVSAVPIYIVLPFEGARSARWETYRGFDLSQNAYSATNIHELQYYRFRQRAHARTA